MNQKDIFFNKVENIANNYHDRVCMSGLFMNDQVCECCNTVVCNTTSIEHDSQDKSKDLSLCTNCYNHIVKYWMNNKPKKLPPVEY